ncbi:trp operon leader peptide [Cedecea sp.]
MKAINSLRGWWRTS